MAIGAGDHEVAILTLQDAVQAVQIAVLARLHLYSRIHAVPLQPAGHIRDAIAGLLRLRRIADFHHHDLTCPLQQRQGIGCRPPGFARILPGQQDLVQREFLQIARRHQDGPPGLQGQRSGPGIIAALQNRTGLARGHHQIRGAGLMDHEVQHGCVVAAAAPRDLGGAAAKSGAEFLLRLRERLFRGFPLHLHHVGDGNFGEGRRQPGAGDADHRGLEKFGKRPADGKDAAVVGAGPDMTQD